MGQTGNPHQIRKIFRFGIDQHLHREVCTKLRNAKRPELTAAEILRSDTERLRVLEETHDLLRIQWNILNRVESRQILQHTNHGRIIVSENIEFQQVVVDRVVIEMRRDGTCRHIVRRVLHRCKRVNLLSEGQYDDTARMLSGGTPHADAAGHDALNLAPALTDSFILIIMRHKTIRCLIRQRTDRPRTEGLSFSEDDLRIAVRPALVLAGEV